jgi:hypothetical protein
MLSARAFENNFVSHKNFFKRLSVLLLILLLAVVISLVSVSYLTAPRHQLTSPQPVSKTTSLFSNGHVVYVDDNSTTNIIVNITGNSLPDDAYFTIITTNYGTDVPQDAGAPLAIEGSSVAGYYDVKVITNITLSPDVTVTVTITNLNFNKYSTMYYYNTTRGNWVSVPTEFKTPHTLVGTFAAIALTGTPIACTSLSTLFCLPEYGVGTLLALFSFFAAFALFKIHSKHTDKIAPTPDIKT